MEFRILGPMEIVCDGALVKVGGPRQQTVLAMLLLEAGKIISVDRLIDAVWDDAPPLTAREQIHICVSTLRRRLTAAHGSNLIETSSPGYQLRIDECALDARVFDARVQEGRHALAEGDLALAATRLRGALGLWRGSTLASIDSPLVQKSVTHLNERRLSVLEECIRTELDIGLATDLVGELTALVQEHPLHERFRALLMTALYRAGRQAEALESYRQGHAVLREELGISPGPDLQGLHQVILSGRPLDGPAAAPFAIAAPTAARAAQAPAAAPPAAAVRAAKQPDPPQAAKAAAAPHAAVRPQRPVPMLLPMTIPDFTGRSTTIREIKASMALTRADSEALPVAVLHGQGGVGKTCVAVHIAHQVAADFPDGQLFAQLQSGPQPADPHDVLGRFLRVLGLSGPTIPHDREERAEVYRDLLAKRRMLVVLDNADSEEQIAPLLPGSARCAVLVTSRRRLTGLPASRVEVGTLSRRSAVALLARVIGEERVRDEPEAVDQLCALCGYLPLALRIVGARLAARPHWSAAALVERLSDESQRLDELNHDTMGVRASISLSYDALSPQAQRLFGRLALTEAPDMASWVAAPLIEADTQRAEDLLEEIAEAYLLDAERGPAPNLVRYRFRDITRLFAIEKLEARESPRDRRAALERLAGALLYLAEEAHRREYAGDYLLLSSRASRRELPGALTDKLLENPLAWYESERQSILASVRQAAAEGLAEHAWSLALATVALFESHSYFSEWRSTHEAALSAACRAGDRRGEAAMRYSLGSLFMVQRNGEEAARQLQHARRLYEELEDQHAAALVLRNLALLDRLNGDMDLAMERWDEALRTFQAMGDDIAEAYVLHNMAQVHLEHGDHQAARTLLARAERICAETGNRRVGAQVRHRLGSLHLLRGEIESAERMYRMVLEMARQAGDRVGECHALLGLATVAMRQNRPRGARRVLAEASDATASVGDPMMEGRVLLARAEVELASGELEAAAGHADQATREFEEIGAAPMQAQGLALLGRVEWAAGTADKALHAWQASMALLSRPKLRHLTALREQVAEYAARANAKLEADRLAPRSGS